MDFVRSFAKKLHVFSKKRMEFVGNEKNSYIFAKNLM